MTKSKNLTFVTGALALGLALSGCGKQAFVVSSTTQSQKAPGSFNIPPKVDILLAEDDSGSIKPIYGQIAQQMPAFLNQLEASNWDYHFATIPLTSDRAMDQITAAKYDPNWGSLWLSPFPGAVMNQIPAVSPSVFRTPENYSGFLTYADTTNGSNGSEQGLENIRKALVNRASGTGFHRQDALLVVLVVGNGQDTSKVNLCNRGDGVVVPCETLGQPACTSISQAGTSNCGSQQISFDWYKNQLSALRPNASYVRFHAAVSPSASSNCLGSRAYAGTRYMQMASALNGQSYDICKQPVTSVLDQLASSLEVTKIAMRTRYLFIDRDPDVSSIQVTKYLDGDVAQAVSIPQDAQNGWTFAGQLNNVYAIDYPIPMNLSSGYAIELHGAAKLSGEDTAKVDYKPAGWQNSAE